MGQAAQQSPLAGHGTAAGTAAAAAVLAAALQEGQQEVSLSSADVVLLR
jgi:putative effector of murein hydrolase